MSEVKFTPGAWYLEDHGYTFIVSKPGDGYITRDVCRMDASTMAAFEQKANAHLIAAAPELYELLQEIYEWTTHKSTPWAVKTKTALAKARGEA